MLTMRQSIGRAALVKMCAGMSTGALAMWRRLSTPPYPVASRFPNDMLSTCLLAIANVRDALSFRKAQAALAQIGVRVDLLDQTSAERSRKELVEYGHPTPRRSQRPSRTSTDDAGHEHEADRNFGDIRDRELSGGSTLSPDARGRAVSRERTPSFRRLIAVDCWRQKEKDRAPRGGFALPSTTARAVVVLLR